jgi:FixJ family two-component response regulator
MESMCEDTEATVFVIEDDVELRQSVEALLSAHGYQCQSFGAVEEFTQIPTAQRKPGCILLDFVLSGCDGLSFLKAYRERADAMPVVVLTGHADVPIAVDFMKAGASTLLKKPYEAPNLLDCIGQALERDRSSLHQRQQVEHCLACYKQLTPRQEQIVESMLEGLPNKLIATKISVSERTVETERAEIIRTFGVKNAVELAVLITYARAAS